MDSTRRNFLQSVSLGAGGVGAGQLLARDNRPAAASGGTGVVDFYGAHQAGIATPAQEYLQFASFDLTGNSLADLRHLLQAWSDAAALMSRGRPVGPLSTGSKPPADTGEGVGLLPSELTVTFGFGPTVFASGGKDPFGLAARRPKPLVNLPPFAGDALDKRLGGGDLGVQVCANDPQVAFHAVHDLIRIARPIAVPRWLLAGFGRTGTSRRQVIPRNLMGFKDGTANIMVENASALKEFVWASEPASPAWMRGGSYLVVRRIQILLGTWDGTGLTSQEQTIGRDKLAGTVLPALPVNAHILLSSPQLNGGQRILRRGYSYLDGIDQATGSPAAGLMFLCYQRDPRRQFIPIQRQLAGSDALNKFVSHIGSAIFACPPGARPGGFVGEGLVQ